MQSSIGRLARMQNLDELAELTYAARDPQFEDPDAGDTDKWLDACRELYDKLDELTGDFTALLNEHENRNVRNALGAINRAMEYLYREL